MTLEATYPIYVLVMDDSSLKVCEISFAVRISSGRVHSIFFANKMDATIGHNCLKNGLQLF